MLNQLNETLQQKWQAHGFNEPTAIQEALFEPMTQGESLIAHSPTGTGKTLAYLLPIIQQTEANKQLQAIVLAPSQELAKQIFDVAVDWTANTDLTVQLIIGGANVKRQIDDLKDKPEIIIATPGRLLEVMNQSRKLKVHTVERIVFDEADYLVINNETGALEPVIRDLTKRLMRDVNYLFISATQSDDLDKVAKRIKEDISTVEVEKTENQTTHIYLEVTNRRKDDTLRQLAHLEGMYGMIFFEQIAQIEQVAAKLLYNGIPVSVLHGDLGKLERQNAIRAFREGETVFLLTTDMASRGIDIPNVSCVIHYNRVANLDTYTHRSGRTGRMGTVGLVISLVNQQEFLDLNNILGSNYTLEKFALYEGMLMPEQMAEEAQVVNRQSAKRPRKKNNRKKRKKK